MDEEKIIPPDKLHSQIRGKMRIVSQMIKDKIPSVVVNESVYHTDTNTLTSIDGKKEFPVEHNWIDIVDALIATQQPQKKPQRNK